MGSLAVAFTRKDQPQISLKKESGPVLDLT